MTYGEDHTQSCSADDCPCFLAGEASARHDLADARTELTVRLRAILLLLDAGVDG